jgi:O-antigen ligase
MTAANVVASLGDFRRATLPRLADALAAAAAASLPWSTSATGILVALWLVASLPTLDIAALRREVQSAPGGLPVLLVALALAGLARSEAPLPELVRGIEPFLRLLMIPVLFAQFRRSEHSMWVGAAFLASGTVLLTLAWTMFWMHLDFGHGPGVPVKDYITQSGVFALCAFALIHIAVDRWIERRRLPAVIAGVLAFLFIANIVYVTTSRTTLVVILALLPVFALQRSSWQALVGIVLAGLVVAGAVWATSPYVRMRVTSVAGEIAESEARETSSGSRLGFWKNSLIVLREAPIFGHGTGMIGEAFRQHPELNSGPPAVNPHNQVFTIGIQLGAVGIAALIAMWAAHWSMFLRPGIAAWAGLMAVTQNIVGSLFNSHLMDFTQTWIYVFAVGVFGAAVLPRRAVAEPEDSPHFPPSPSPSLPSPSPPSR